MQLSQGPVGQCKFWIDFQGLFVKPDRLILGLAILVIGLLLVRLLSKLVKKVLARLPITVASKATVQLIINVMMYSVVVALIADFFGAKSANVVKLLIVVILVIVAAIMVFRRYMPDLPFKPGHTVKLGGILGKVEATTFLNTRIRTFDGKTVWIPNKKIYNDVVINYHFTATRKISMDVGIRYDGDLIKAKQVLEAVMIEDARTLNSPRPQVFVIGLMADNVTLGGRCWVANDKYWRTRCDLLEKVKLRFDNEGIAFAFPVRDIFLHHDSAGEDRKHKDSQLEPYAAFEPLV